MQIDQNTSFLVCELLVGESEAHTRPPLAGGAAPLKFPMSNSAAIPIDWVKKQETVNNGINEFIFVLRRANYILPSRAQRSFPLLPGRAAVL